MSSGVTNAPPEPRAAGGPGGVRAVLRVVTSRTPLANGTGASVHSGTCSKSAGEFRAGGRAKGCALGRRSFRPTSLAGTLHGFYALAILRVYILSVKDKPTDARRANRLQRGYSLSRIFLRHLLSTIPIRRRLPYFSARLRGRLMRVADANRPAGRSAEAVEKVSEKTSRGFSPRLTPACRPAGARYNVRSVAPSRPVQPGQLQGQLKKGVDVSPCRKCLHTWRWPWSSKPVHRTPRYSLTRATIPDCSLLNTTKSDALPAGRRGVVQVAFFFGFVRRRPGLSDAVGRVGATGGATEGD
jgi:hypothetical protein